MSRKIVTVCALAVVLGTAAPAADTEKDVMETVLSLKGHTILAAAIQEAGLAKMLRDTKPVTLFAPTDAAFRELGDDAVRSLVANPERLTKLVMAHVAKGQEVRAKDAAPFIGPAKVTRKDVKCGNGMIQVIDTVLVPAK